MQNLNVFLNGNRIKVNIFTTDGRCAGSPQIPPLSRFAMLGIWTQMGTLTLHVPLTNFTTSALYHFSTLPHLPESDQNLLKFIRKTVFWKGIQNQQHKTELENYFGGTANTQTHMNIHTHTQSHTRTLTRLDLLFTKVLRY